MIRIFERKPDPHAAIFAEARALMDEGLELAFVLDLFPEDAEWLRGELETSATVAESFAAGAAPSYYFEASLKARFLAAAEEQPTVAPTPRKKGFALKTAVTTLSLSVAAAAAGVVALGFITAGSSVPGDWNYSFKIAGERLQYALSPRGDRVNVQIQQAQARVYEIQQLAQHGDVSQSDITRLQNDVQAIATLAQKQPLTNVQKAQLQGVAETSQVVLQDATAKQPALEEPVTAAGQAIHAAVLMALAVPPKVTPSATTTASPSPSAVTTTPSPTATVTSTPVITPTTPPNTPQPSPTPIETPAPTETPIPTETAAPTVSPTAAGEDQTAGAQAQDAAAAGQ